MTEHLLDRPFLVVAKGGLLFADAVQAAGAFARSALHERGEIVRVLVRLVAEVGEDSLPDIQLSGHDGAPSISSKPALAQRRGRT